VAYAVLLMIGGTLFVNGLAVLEIVDAKGIAVYNIFTGILGTVAPFYLLTRVDGLDKVSFDTVLSVAPMWFFALTFLWVGINSISDNTPTGLGWYCLWVVFMAVAFSLVNFLRFDAFGVGVIWLNWAFLWGLFWLLLGLGKEHLATFTGWVAVLQSVWTVTLQALLNMVGGWSVVPAWAFVTATAATIVIAWGAARHRGTPAEPAGNREFPEGQHMSKAAT
jgi:hypothetical protein